MAASPSAAKRVYQHCCACMQMPWSAEAIADEGEPPQWAHLPSVHQVFHPMGGVRPSPAREGGTGGGVVRMQRGRGRKAASLAVVQSESRASCSEEQETGKHVATFHRIADGYRSGVSRLEPYKEVSHEYCYQDLQSAVGRALLLCVCP